MIYRPGPKKPIVSKSTLTVYQDYTLPAAKNVLIVSVAGGAQGSGAKGTGSSASKNDLISSSQNFANTPDVNGSYLGLSAVGNTLVAGNSAATTLQGGAGNDCLYAAGSVNPVSMYGGSGSSTMVGGSGKATFVGGNLSNSLVAGSGDQLLQGGKNYSTTTYLDNTGKKTTTVTTGNTLIGGSGKDTLFGGTGYNTLVAGSVASIDTILAANAKKGSTQIKVKTTKDLQVGQAINGVGLATGCVIKKISGNTITLSKKTLDGMVRDTPLRAIPSSVSNTLIGNGISSSLVASTQGNDSLTGGSSSSSTIIGGTGRDTLVAGTMAGASSWLQSGASSAMGATGNSLIGSAQSNSSVTMVAASTSDSLSAGPGANTFVLNAVNKEAFAAAHFSLGTFSTLSSSRVTGTQVVAISSIPGGSPLTAGSFAFSDTILSGLQSAVSSYKKSKPGAKVPVTLINNLGKAEFISLSGISDSLGLSSVVAGNVQSLTTFSDNGGPTKTLYGDTIDASSMNAGLTLDASQSKMPTFLLGGGSDDLIILSQAGNYARRDTVKGGAGTDTVKASNTLFGAVDGGKSSVLYGGANSLQSGDMLALSVAGVTLGTGSFVGVQNMENLSLFAGANYAGSLQGSGILRMIGGSGSDTMLGNNYAILAANASTGSTSLVLSVPTGSPQGTNLGFIPSEPPPEGHGLATLVGSAMTGSLDSLGNLAFPATLTVHQVGNYGVLKDSVSSGSESIRIYQASDDLSTFTPGRTVVYGSPESLSSSSILNVDYTHINDSGSPYIDITLNGSTIDSIRAGTSVTLVPPSLQANQTITGYNIPTGTTISSIVSASGQSPLDFDVTLSGSLSGPLGPSSYVSTYNPQYLTGNGIPSGAYVTSTLSGEATLAQPASLGATVLTLQSIPDLYRTGQTLTGNGIPDNTTIKSIDKLTNSITLSAGINKALDSLSVISDGLIKVGVSAPTTVAIAAGRPLNGWFSNMSLDGSQNTGQGTTNSNATLTATNYVKALAKALNNPVGNPGEEIANRDAFLQALQQDPNTFIHLSGDSLTALGRGALLISPDDINGGLPLGTSFEFDDLIYKITHKTGSILPPGGNAAFASATMKYVIDSTLNASPDPTVTLVGNSGHTVYLLNNPSGTSVDLPNILLHDSMGSGYLATANAGTSGEIRFSGDNLTLDVGSNYSRVTPGAVNQISINNGNNLVHILPSSGINQTFALNGGNGSDTLYTEPDFSSNVFIDARKGSGAQSLSSGQGDDTILGGSGNATITGGDGNNSLIGGAGTNIITSGVGNSTLDGGYGASTLQAIAGQNLMVIRNRKARILLNSDKSLNPEKAELELSVNSYVNFDPIQSTEVNQFAPDYPDGSPSITKSQSFASSDLASFYSIKNFNLLADFQTGYGAIYGVGNALGNNITQGRDPGVLNPNENIVNNPNGALLLGMGGNNTLTSWGKYASLYGFSNESYANPDLYATAPTDTRTQDFITNVMGTPGNNLLVAYGSGSFLDGGPGYNAGNGSPSSNTLVGNSSNDTFIVRNTADSLVAATGFNKVYSTVNLNQLTDNITEAVLVVADQSQYFKNFSGNAPVLPSSSGQDAPSNYLSYGSAHANSKTSHQAVLTNLTISVPNSSQMEVQYGTYALNHFQSDNVPTPDTNTRDQYFPLNVSVQLPDNNNPGKIAYVLNWNAPLMRNTDVIAGYTVLYQAVAYQNDTLNNPGHPLTDANGTKVLASQTLDGNGDIVPLTDSLGGDLAPSETPFLTYLNGTSSDLQGTQANPYLTVDNLPTFFTSTPGQTYSTSDSGIIYDFNFQVTAIQLEHPFTFDANGNEVATPVTLRGNSGNDVIWTYSPERQDIGYGQNLGASTYFKNVNPVLGNNPADPLSAGTIPLTGPYSLSHYDSQLFPVYLNGADGSNLLLSNQIGNGDGSSFTIQAGTASNPQILTYSGLNTMEGGKGSDTFVVANGTQNNFDLCIKYGSETPVDYTNTAPGAPSSISQAGVSLNGGQHNLIISQLACPTATIPSGYQASAGSTIKIQSLFGDTLTNGATSGFAVGQGITFDFTSYLGATYDKYYTGYITNIDSGSGTITLSSAISAGLASALNNGAANIRAISGLQLSNTTTSQGKFIDQLMAYSGQLNVGAQLAIGNHLDNFIYDAPQNAPFNTLVGGGGRDCLLANASVVEGKDVLIGGTAVLGDNIGQAMKAIYGIPLTNPTGLAPVAVSAPLLNSKGETIGYQAGYYLQDSLGNFKTDSLNNNNYVAVSSSTPTVSGASLAFSTYRDADLLPATLLGGPGSADPSQYWMASGTNGTSSYDPLRNSDTLIGLISGTLDGGAGDDSMIGGAGGDNTDGSAKGDYFVVSSGPVVGGSDNAYYFDLNRNATGTVVAGRGDVVVGNGGNDTVCYTGSDLWWSGRSDFNHAMTFALSVGGDAQNGQSVSNIVLGPGAPNAINAYGNAKTTGQQHKGNLGNNELGSNLIIGNEFNNTIDGLGVGGDGSGYGCDTLLGGGGNDTLGVTGVPGGKYRLSSSDRAATYTTSQVTLAGSQYRNTYTTTPGTSPTDADYAIIGLNDISKLNDPSLYNPFTTSDKLQLTAAATGYAYALGVPPSSYGASKTSFCLNNIQGSNAITTTSRNYGIYYVDLSGTNIPNLVANIQTDFDLDKLGSDLIVNSKAVDGLAGYGSSSFAWDSTSTSQDNAAGLSFLGFGHMYQLQSGVGIGQYILGLS